MNISILEDWARANNRQPEHYEHGSTVSSGESTIEAARKHLEPAHQLLQWLQVSSSIGEDFEALITTLQQLPRLTPTQLIHAVKYYRAEVGEKALPKSAMKYLSTLQEELAERRAQDKATKRESKTPISTPDPSKDSPTTPQKVDPSADLPPSTPSSQVLQKSEQEENDFPDNLFMDPAFVLPFSLPTLTDMLVSYGAGFGGKNRERERKYIPTVPPEFLSKLDFSNGSQKSSIYEGRSWDTSD
jgi:hypothetical protein